MARIARITVPGVLHHVISRFVDRDWFFASADARHRHLALLGRALAKSDWRCVAYCLMSNHIHLAMVGGEHDLESWTKRVNSPFATWLNQQRGRLGPVFADRPAVYLVPRDREAAVIAYIHNNPVRAKVVANARASTWSSHQAYVGLAKPPPWLHVRDGLRRAGCATDRARFDELVEDLADAALDLPDLARTRADVRRLGPYELATPTLSDPIEVPVVRRALARTRPSPAAVLALVSSVTGVSAMAANQPRARGRVSSARRVFVHAAVSVGIGVSDAAALISVSRQRGAKVAQTPLPPKERALVKKVVAMVKAGGR